MSAGTARNLLLATAVTIGGLWLVSKGMDERKRISALAPPQIDHAGNVATLERDVAALRSELAQIGRQRPTEASGQGPGLAQATAAPAAPIDRMPTPEERHQATLEAQEQAVA